MVDEQQNSTPDEASMEEVRTVEQVQQEAQAETRGAAEIQTAIPRFNIYHRLEHWIFMGSFTTLAITGLVQKFSDNAFSTWFIESLNGLDNVRQIHHVAAVVMMLVTIYHIGAVAYRLYVLRVRPTMLPSLYDVRAAWEAAQYYLGLKKRPPQQGRYTFEEKVEYWAVVWGTIVMAFTGFMMWNPIMTSRYLPGEAIPAAKVAHGLEAVLAVLAIFLWHFYHVLIKTFNKSMFTGRLTMEQMLEEHPLELADLKAGIAVRPVDPVIKKRRERIFFPIYGVAAVIMLSGVYFFVSGEQTAITTISPVTTEVVFAPLTPTPLPTPLPTQPSSVLSGATTWDGGIGALLGERCGACHNASAKIGGLDLSSYAAALSGGASGKVITPGDADGSLLISKQTAGGHPGQLSAEEIQVVRGWIQAGAKEK